MTPDAAVEAALNTIIGGDEVTGPDIALDLLSREQIRLILEAAAPHLMAQAWDEAFKAGGDWANTCRVWFDDPPTKPRNPYRTTK